MYKDALISYALSLASEGSCNLGVHSMCGVGAKLTLILPSVASINTNGKIKDSRSIFYPKFRIALSQPLQPTKHLVKCHLKVNVGL